MTNAKPQPGASAEEAWRAAVARWLSTAASELDCSGFAQIDVDDLLRTEPAQAVEAALFCMNIAVKDATWAATPVGGLVVVPLEPRKRMTGPVPKLQDVLSRKWRYGPGRRVPGIYLLTPAAWAAYEPVEEYRVDLGSDGLGPDHVAYYRAWKGATEEDEFERAVYVRHLRR